MRWLVCVVAISAPVLVAHVALGQDFGPGSALPEHIELRTLDQARQSFSWHEGINRNGLCESGVR